MKLHHFDEPLVQRFCRFIRVLPNGCWEWIGGTKDGRYGTFWMHGKPIRAHRASVLLSGRELRDDQKVLHSCDHSWCIHPDHLTPGTQLENVRDMIAKGRAWFQAAA